MKTRYRIVTDAYAGYEAQVKYWWTPFWIEIRTNSFGSVEEAEEFTKGKIEMERMRSEKGQFVKYVDVD